MQKLLVANEDLKHHDSEKCRVVLEVDQATGSIYLLEADGATGSTYL